MGPRITIHDPELLAVVAPIAAREGISVEEVAARLIAGAGRGGTHPGLAAIASDTDRAARSARARSILAAVWSLPRHDAATTSTTFDAWLYDEQGLPK